MDNYSNAILSAILSNLAKAAEKQQLHAEARDLGEQSQGYWEPLSGNAPTDGINALRKAVEADITVGYPSITSAAARDRADDPGALRCVKWGEKVSSIQKSLLSRYESKGEDLFTGKNLYICEACGFIALAVDIPQLCPVCKAPKSRFSRVK